MELTLKRQTTPMSPRSDRRSDGAFARVLRESFPRAFWNVRRGIFPRAKRLMDVLAAGCGLIALAPLLACVAALIRWEDGGPILFRQERVGRGGRRFSMYKFRSMSCDAEARRADLQSGEHDGDEVRFKMRRDPRVTRVGRWIRRFSIDEVPQLWNIVRGDMALVGPRPPLPQEVATYDWREWHRLDVRPGLTCTWQITGRSEIPFPRQVALDLEYILDPSLRRDAALVLGTVPAVLSGHGAY